MSGIKHGSAFMMRFDFGAFRYSIEMGLDSYETGEFHTPDEVLVEIDRRVAEVTRQLAKAFAEHGGHRHVPKVRKAKRG